MNNQIINQFELWLETDGTNEVLKYENLTNLTENDKVRLKGFTSTEHIKDVIIQLYDGYEGKIRVYTYEPFLKEVVNTMNRDVSVIQDKL